ncbi:hypothetical protein CNMCM8980_003524 [Aspergillus fumigatiaffinis]|uniref:Uncharacterized protein n=1 Tax=Aspergillus fumigatiaffinis TaxID=340414 RepID=A0A8H4HBK2_9EURO|nr:hypothetical protein CNMCM5878_006075 [Aspergillus fumigatiaffinis]KAF4239691.1 hypothetical protein CNMCM6457_008611 [Aspergillus fumigatiaffinis]KAF4245619.1 hypothetical protein CNMCM6805_003563 [Aspergillus fumigatiaffinis]KAF4251901.1 hypothetical protein CNMCM8980_003524 [Aspergillus fumigatiaffinis]
MSNQNDPSAPHLIPVDDCLTYETGYRPNLPGQRTWWVFCPVTGLFDSSYSLLGAMIECVARGQATLTPAWDRTFAGGIWYDFDCAADVLDEQVLMDMAVSDMQRRIERLVEKHKDEGIGRFIDRLHMDYDNELSSSTEYPAPDYGGS